MLARAFLSVLLLVPVTFLAAGSDPATPDPAEPSSAPSLEAKQLEIDPVHSVVLFRIQHLNASWFHGRFNDVGGTIAFDPAAPEKSRIEIRVKADSVDTNAKGRDDHLRGSDFFAAKEFPEITFVSRSVKKHGEHELDVTGDLTLHGVTKPVTTRVVHVGSSETPKFGKRTGFEATFTVKRSDFGMKFMIGMLGDEVRLTVALEGMEK